tara:strand:+ start:626 stop:895 length:270 start_codon:yes stop_codon:yes gene_type:complete
MVKMNEDCQFLKDLNTAKNFGGLSKGLYNLAVCKGQVKLFSKGIKPTRFWRLKDVKNYFGLVGGTNKILSQLEQLDTIIKDINLTNERD